jgi:large subunit ribosomal protein L19
MNAQEIINGLQEKKHPHFQPGDTVRVHIRIIEGEKERIQIFQGIVIAKKGGGNSASFIVRKMSFGVGVERIFPMQCTNIEKIEIVEQGRVRQSKLFYIRKLKGKSLRITKDGRERNITGDEGLTETTAIEQPSEENADEQKGSVAESKSSAAKSETTEATA